MRITAIEPFVCDGGLREFGFLKVTTDEGIVGWAETYDWHTSASLMTTLDGDGPAAHRRGPAPDRAHERAHLVRRPARRAGADEGPRRHGPRALGHQGEVAGRAGVRAHRRPVPRPDPALLVAFRDLPCGLAGGARAAGDQHLRGMGGRRPGRRRPGLQGPQDEPHRRRAAPTARHACRSITTARSTRGRSTMPWRGSARCATSSGPASGSPSTSSSTTGWAASCSSPGRWSRSTCTGWRSRASTPTRCSRRASRPRPGCATARASSGARQFRPFLRTTSPTS